ncbi:hypothetical protein CWATWH8502_3070 [Crocosphaera watsonii WH 8502]|nr:hypothetical protein CWATWH8502_3070 [Crocosphaera watsonii WH 8502]CCQ63553.1 hypothetical protein CWATWH0401_2007 [Crocosphaera watsonii WH 0401]
MQNTKRVMLGFVSQPNLQDQRSHYKIGDRTKLIRNIRLF